MLWAQIGLRCIFDLWSAVCWELRAPCGAQWSNSKTNRPTNRNMFFIILTHNFLFDYMILLQIFLLYFLNLKVAINALANWKIRDEIIETSPYLFDDFLLSLPVAKHYSASAAGKKITCWIQNSPRYNCFIKKVCTKNVNININ